MLTKNETKYIQSLFHKRERDANSVFVAEGPKLAAELLSAAVEIVHIYALDSWLQRHSQLRLPVTQVADFELQRISNLQTPNEVLLIARQQKLPAEPVFSNRITLLLDGIQDPGNMGTIVRTADWFGIAQLVCSADSADIYNPKVVQATMGSITRVRCWYRDFGTFSLPQNIPVFGALLSGANVFDLPKVAEGILVIGNESRGIREPLLQSVTHPVTIPRLGNAESLNAAVAAGIIMAQLTR